MWGTQPNFKPEELAKITANVTLADGEHDEVIRRGHMRTLAKLIPRAKYLPIPNASHFALWQRPDFFNEALKKFMRDE